MENSAKDDEISLLKEILKWLKFAGMKEVKAVLTSELDSDQKKLVYQLSDGTKTNAEINKISGVSTGSISGYWKKWLKLGLGETKAVTGGDRFVRAFDLGDFGITVLQDIIKKSEVSKDKEVPKGEKKA
jgi:hypothetical protein